jgi:formylglycine-generating enzyme required for sulfatase activity
MEKFCLLAAFVFLWGISLVACQKSTAIPMETPAPGIGSTMTGKDDMTLVFVPAGEFTMGSENGGAGEKPVHTVYLDAFCIDQTEVTNGMYAKCVDANRCDQPGTTTQFGNMGYASYPVVYVSWKSANAYCSWAERRLPTEAEWEKARRITADGSSKGSKSPYGLKDIAGDVWEWVNDWYDESYYQSSPTINPLGPDSGKYRVIRGGSLTFGSVVSRSVSRFWDFPSYSNHRVGFRCARSE